MERGTVEALIDRLTASGVIFLGLAILVTQKIDPSVMPFLTSIISAAAAFIFTAEVYNKKSNSSTSKPPGS